jgi:hypothetical protein
MKMILPDAIDIAKANNSEREVSLSAAPSGIPRESSSRRTSLISLAKPLSNEMCLDVNCADFLQCFKLKTEHCPHLSVRNRC